MGRRLAPSSGCIGVICHAGCSMLRGMTFRQSLLFHLRMIIGSLVLLCWVGVILGSKCLIVCGAKCMSGGLVGLGLFVSGLLWGCSGCGGLYIVGWYGKDMSVVHYS